MSVAVTRIVHVRSSAVPVGAPENVRVAALKVSHDGHVVIALFGLIVAAYVSVAPSGSRKVFAGNAYGSDVNPRSMSGIGFATVGGWFAAGAEIENVNVVAVVPPRPSFAL